METIEKAYKSDPNTETLNLEFQYQLFIAFISCSRFLNFSDKFRISSSSSHSLLNSTD